MWCQADETPSADETLPPASRIRPGVFGALALAFLLLVLAGCTGLNQVAPTGRNENISLENGNLQEQGLALITPSTVTGQEEDRQALALAFAGVLGQSRPKIRLATLSETLGAINRDGLADEYQQMFVDYRDTGIFNRDTLKKIGAITNSRYLGQLKLANFHQDSSGRFSVLGLRVLKTKSSNIRMFMTIWDSWDGSIAWEGMQELNYAYETVKEKPISFKKAVDEASKELIKQFP
jgi:hypothetical protein